jgi:membrane protein required for colicin V production
MNWIDAAIVIILLFFLVTAFQNGLIRETISMASAVGGVVLAGFFYDDVADALLGSIDNETTKSVVAFLIIFAGVTVAGQLVAILVHPAIVIMQLGIADQLLGAAFGIVKGFVIIEALLILMVTYPRYDMDKRIDDSNFGTRMLDMAEPVLKVLPQEFDARVGQFTGDGGGPFTQ